MEESFSKGVGRTRLHGKETGAAREKEHGEQHFDLLPRFLKKG